MLDVRFVPITQWPGQPTRARCDARFKASYSQTLRLLESELRLLGARNATVQAFFTIDQLRNDGWPYAAARPSAPGIILSFTAKGNSLSFPCDKYRTLDDNLRAIALSLQSLRAVDRYGVTKRAEQYAGWKQIEAPTGYGFTSKEEAAIFMATQADDDTSGHDETAGYILRDAEWRAEAYRRAVKRLHPDRGGDHELFVRLQQAKAMLEAV